MSLLCASIKIDYTRTVRCRSIPLINRKRLMRFERWPATCFSIESSCSLSKPVVKLIFTIVWSAHWTARWLRTEVLDMLSRNGEPRLSSAWRELTIALFCSALGSFYIPMLVMLFFYWRIYNAAVSTTRAINQGFRTTKASKMLGTR